MSETLRLDDSKPRTSRQQIADPHYGVPYLDRLRAANAVDLRDNARIVDLGNGYIRVEAIDPTKRHGNTAAPAEGRGDA